MKLVVTLKPDTTGGDTNRAWAAWNGGTIRLLQFYQRGKELPMPTDKPITITIEADDD